MHAWGFKYKKCTFSTVGITNVYLNPGWQRRGGRLHLLVEINTAHAVWWGGQWRQRRQVMSNYFDIEGGAGSAMEMTTAGDGDEQWRLNLFMCVGGWGVGVSR